MKTAIYLKSLLIIISLSIGIKNLQAQVSGIKSQFSNGFEIGFKEGYCYNTYKANCLTPLVPLTPLPTLNESSESYQDGFNRGFQTGLDLRRLEGRNGGNPSVINYQSIPKYRYKDYVPTLPIDAYINVLAYKQSVLDGRTKWLRERVQGVIDLNYSLLFNLDIDSYNNISNTINDALGNKLKGVSGDFADDNIFRQVLSIINFPKLETEIYTAYQKALSKIEDNSKENKFIDLLNNANKNLSDNPKFSLQLVQEAENLNVESQYSYQINNIKSHAYANLEDYKTALVYVDKYIWSVNITHDEMQTAICHKAALLMNLNEPKAALLLFDNSVFDNANKDISNSILFGKISAYYKLADYENCILNADKFLKFEHFDESSESDFIFAMQLKAASLRELHRYQEAIEVINLAIKKNNSTSNPSLYGTRGKIYYGMKDYKTALNDFIRCTVLDDTDAESFYYLSLCYKNLNQKSKACENLQKAIKNGSTEALDEYPKLCK